MQLKINLGCSPPNKSLFMPSSFHTVRSVDISPLYFQNLLPSVGLIYFRCVAILDKQTSKGFVTKVATKFAIIIHVNLCV